MKISEVFKDLFQLKGKKLTVQFSDGLTKLIEKKAQERNTNELRIIQDAIALYYDVTERLKKKKGLKLSITTENDKIVQDYDLTTK